MPEVTNWFGELRSHPAVVRTARTVDDLVSVVTDTAGCPSPVRAVGSNHSTTACGVAEGGTLVEMRHMDRILHIGDGTVTTEAGALYKDVSLELRRHQLQFAVNIELGNLTMGSAATCATKDASFPGELGQVNSYAVGMKLVTASGDLLEITEEQPELLQMARSSYGLFGIVYEVTFRVFPLKAMDVRHQTFTVDELERALPTLVQQGQSMMFYLFPFADRVAIELRQYEAGLPAGIPWLWTVRNLLWEKLAPLYGQKAVELVGQNRLRYLLVDGFNSLLRTLLRFMHQPRTAPSDQTIRYPAKSGMSRYTFSIWAFPEEEYIPVLRAYFELCRRWYRERGYRCNMLNVGYRIAADQSSLLSYTFDGTVITVDPVSTGGPGWAEFLDAYNELCSAHGGRPLLNQTPRLTRTHVDKAFGERIATLRREVQRRDPDQRLLNDYFRGLLG